MLRVDVTKKREHWKLRCGECGSQNWRCNDGTFECLACGTAGLPGLEHASSGEFIKRTDIEFVGGESNWKAKYASRQRR